MSFLLADNLEVPLPNLSGDGLTDRAQDSERGHGTSHMLVASSLEQTQGSRGDVKLGDLVLIDNVPVPREVGVGGCALKDDGRNTKKQRGIHDVRVAGNPADVTTAEVPVTVMDVEDVLSGHGTAKEVTCGGVHDTLRFACGSGRVQQEHGVLGVDDLGGDVAGPLLYLLVPPQVAAGCEGDVGASALVYQAAGNIGALLQRIVDNLLGANQLAAALALVGGDDDLGVGIDNTVPEGVGGEASKNDRVDGADTHTGEQGDESLGNHGEVDGDGVALADAHLLQDPGGLGDIPEQLAVGDIAALACLVCLVDDGDAVGVCNGVAIDAVVSGIELALDEPGIVTVSERAGVDSVEVALPRQQLAGALGPEGVGLCDGLLVQLLVFL